VDYSYTYKNLHFFGEAGMDKRTETAFVNGLLVSVDPRVDLSVVQRTISPAYQAVNGNAFTENTYPSNETGFYAGVSIRPVMGWRLDAYGDIYTFPWLKYLSDAPGQGKDYLVQLTYTPGKSVEIYTRYRSETKQTNQPDNSSVSNFLVYVPKKSWRTHLSYKLNTAITLRNRVELVWYARKTSPEEPSAPPINPETGFLAFFDLLYKPLLKPYSAVLRAQFFETSGYDSRVYAYENDVLYSYSIPPFFDKGFRYYVNLNYDLSKKLSLWMRWAQSIYQARQTIGTGLDEIPGNRRTDVKFQVRWFF
jgi:hypothetical protein